MRPRQLCTCLSHYGRRISSEAIILTWDHRSFLRVQSLPGPRFPLISGFWVCASGSRSQGTQVEPH